MNDRERSTDPVSPSLQLEQVHALLEESTQTLPGTIGPGTELGGLTGWDSMGLVIFIEAVQTRWGIELPVHELRACSHSPQVLTLIQRTASS